MSHPLFDSLIESVGLPKPTQDRVSVIGTDPVVDTPFKVGETAAAVLAAQGYAVSRINQMRGGEAQEISVEAKAAALATASVFFQSQHGYPIMVPEPDYPTVGLYPTLDGRHILVHGGYPLLRDGMLDLLRCADKKSSVANAIAKWNAFELEEAIADKGLCGAVMRSPKEWLSHPQGQAIADMPPVEVIKLADSEPVPFTPAQRPLEGVRVLDLTHVIAGPTCAKSLAEQGAAVMHVTCPFQPNLPPFVMDTGHGKLSALLDLKQDMDKVKLRELLKTADVFSQSYRPGKLTSLGFSPEGLAQMRPGIIVVSTSCYGHSGPWHFRPGFEQLAQTVTGMAAVQGSMDSPQLAPTFPNDYITGFLSSLGVLAALYRRATEGGSYHVRVSLSRTAMFLMEQGLVDRAALPPTPIAPDYRAAYMREEDSALGRLSYLGPVIKYSKTPGRFDLQPFPLGAHEPVWPANTPSLRSSTDVPKAA